MIKDKTKAFKAYDVRGTLGESLDAQMCLEIGRALIDEFQAKKVAIGADARPSSPELKNAMIDGMRMQGADVIDLGARGTEEIYFAAQHLDIDVGIEVTASHNPIGDNGLKFILRGGVPVSTDQLLKIRDRIVAEKFEENADQGEISAGDITDAYIDHLLTYVDISAFKDMKILTNAGNGMAGHVVDALEARITAYGISSPFVKMHHEPDSTFPNGIPNPLLPENRAPTSAKVKEVGANFAVAWDGDFDRCFLYDEKGGFIEGYYVVGLLADAFLRENSDQVIVFDPRMTWNTIEIVQRLGGRYKCAKVGHVFMKHKMRSLDAVYGGEMSAHHYFRDFGYCDSGMIPWLLITQLLANSNQTLSEIVVAAQAAFPCSGEINTRVNDVNAAIAKVRTKYVPLNPEISEIDGLSMEFPDWRFNLRASNTEPLLRLNIETRGDLELLKEKTAELKALLNKD